MAATFSPLHDVLDAIRCNVCSPSLRLDFIVQHENLQPLISGVEEVSEPTCAGLINMAPFCTQVLTSITSLHHYISLIITTHVLQSNLYHSHMPIAQILRSDPTLSECLSCEIAQYP